jgi:PAS domain S-box-containing protein
MKGSEPTNENDTACRRALKQAVADLTERLRASEAALRRSEEYRRLLAQAVKGVIYDIDFRTTEVRHSEGLLDLVGISSDEAPMDAAWWLELIHPDDLAAVERATRELLTGGAEQMALEYRVRHQDGRWIHVWDRSRMLRDEAGRPVRLVGIATDITARKEAEAALRESERRFRCAIEEAPIPVMMYAETGELLALSRTVTQITGYAPEEIATLEAWLERAYGERAPQARAFVTRYFARGASFPGTEFVVRTTRGEARIWQFTAGSPDRLTDGRRYVVAFAMDITERKQAERALQQAKEAAERANAAKTRFLAAASHDLRQPLQALDLQRAVLARRIAEPEALATVRELGASIDAMRGTLDTLLDLSQLETGAIHPEIGCFALEDLLNRVGSEFRGLAAAKGLELRIVPSRAVVRSDPRLLERILQNLVSNAVKYTQAGRVLLGCRRRGRRLRIEVWDTGIGIARDQTKAIFEEFYQVANPARERRFGLGLGLSIARAAAELLGIRLDVRSTLGRGSVFRVEVPLEGTAKAASASSRERAAAARAGKPLGKILLVEDDAAISSALRAFLAGEGYAVTVAGSGREALALAEAGGFRPTMALVDQNLPGELSGVETVLRLRRLFSPRHLPALVITGDVLPDRLEAIRRAALPHLTKPVNAEELRLAIQSLIGRDGGTPAAGRMPEQAGRADPAGGARAGEAGPLDQLTERERDVIGLVAAGLPNKEVAYRLGISQRTVEGHRARAMQKLGVRTLAELVRLTLAAGADLP